mgnify:CR=1 FL=1
MKCFEIELIVFHFLLFDSNLSKGNGRIMESFWDIPSRKYPRRNVV